MANTPSRNRNSRSSRNRGMRRRNLQFVGQRLENNHSNRGGKWTEEEKRKLLYWRDCGFTHEECAARLGRTALATRLHTYQCKQKIKNGATEEEVFTGRARGSGNSQRGGRGSRRNDSGASGSGSGLTQAERDADYQTLDEEASSRRVGRHQAAVLPTIEPSNEEPADYVLQSGPAPTTPRRASPGIRRSSSGGFDVLCEAVQLHRQLEHQRQLSSPMTLDQAYNYQTPSGKQYRPAYSYALTAAGEHRMVITPAQPVEPPTTTTTLPDRTIPRTSPYPTFSTQERRIFTSNSAHLATNEANRFRSWTGPEAGRSLIGGLDSLTDPAEAERK
ncbi:Hypothetical protein D9617_9g025470 [Elsinoe fawcettii]|nr:Hypothetical protein D9617_9g025470 [Elsinoe fawcettii]